MKKIILLLGLLFIFEESPKAYMISIDHDNENYTYKYEVSKSGNRFRYLLTLENESIDIKDVQTVNNLASYYNTYDLYENVVIQKLIFEEVNPNYVVKVLDDNLNVIDTTDKENEIFSKIKEYQRPDPQNNAYYEANYGEDLRLYPDIKGCYLPKGYSYTCDNLIGYSITMNHGTGLIKVDFKNVLYSDGKYVFKHRMQYEPFSIFVNVHGRAVTFDIKPDDSFIFSVYNKYRYLRDIQVDSRELTHYFKEEDLRFVDVSAGMYEKMDDFWVTKDETIKLRPNLRTVSVEFDTYLMDIYLNNTDYKTYNDFSIYDENNNYVASCNKEKCIMNLKAGQYYIKDNVSNLTQLKSFFEDSKDIVYRELVDGIVSDKEILKIKHDDIDIIFNKDKNIYYFDEITDYKYLDIYFENEIKRIFLSDYQNYWKIMDFTTLYKIPNDNKTKDEDKPTQPPIHEDESIDSPIQDDKLNNEIKNNPSTELEINVPNTGVEKEDLIYKKEEYEKDINNTNNNFIL